MTTGTRSNFPAGKKTECDIHRAVVSFVRSNLFFERFPFFKFQKRKTFKLAAVLSYNHRIDVGTGERW